MSDVNQPLEPNEMEGVYQSAMAYRMGKGVNKDFEEAVRLLRIAAERGHVAAQCELGKVFLKGNSIKPSTQYDPQEGLKWTLLAMAAGSAEAKNVLGTCYFGGKGVKQDYWAAVQLFRAAAEHGEVNAYRNLAHCYRNGDGVTRNYKEAIKWYLKAAEQGDFEAFSHYAYCIGAGMLGKDVMASVELVERMRVIAEQGDSKKQVKMAAIYTYGQGVAKDLVEAVRWYRLAAAKGNTDAMFHLGLNYQHGKGVEKDEVKAVWWYREAMARGNVGAMLILGSCYVHGIGVPQNAEEGIRIWELAADRGQSLALFNIAKTYERGDGVAQDYEKAAHYYRLAIKKGEFSAYLELKELVKAGKCAADRSDDEFINSYIAKQNSLRNHALRK